VARAFRPHPDTSQYQRHKGYGCRVDGDRQRNERQSPTSIVGPTPDRFKSLRINPCSVFCATAPSRRAIDERGSRGGHCLCDPGLKRRPAMKRGIGRGRNRYIGQISKCGASVPGGPRVQAELLTDPACRHRDRRADDRLATRHQHARPFIAAEMAHLATRAQSELLGQPPALF
jgi:hypothetical protein